MGQWGKVRKVGDMLFMPHVKTGAFDPIICDSRIDDIFSMKDGGNEILAKQMLQELKQQYVGECYNEW